MQRDPYLGVPTRPFSQHPYAYALANPVNYTDPTGRYLGYVWGDPTCQFIGWQRVRERDLNWQDGTLWGGAAAHLTPVIGDFKGFAEVFTGCDLVTGEGLGAWRYADLIPLLGPAPSARSDFNALWRQLATHLASPKP